MTLALYSTHSSRFALQMRKENLILFLHKNVYLSLKPAVPYENFFGGPLGNLALSSATKPSIMASINNISKYPFRERNNYPVNCLYWQNTD